MNRDHPPAAQEGKLLRNVEIGTLCAFYGALLTDRQREATLLYYDEDLSLAEIAEQFGASRQNVHDLLIRSVQKLERYEEALGGIAQARRMAEGLQAARQELVAAKRLSSSLVGAHIGNALRQITQIIQDANGEEGETHGI